MAKENEKYILAIDHGTSGQNLVLFLFMEKF